MSHNWYTRCPKCGRTGRKMEMRPIFTAQTRYAPPKILCYLCEACFCDLLEEWEVAI